MDLNLTLEESAFRDELRAWLAANAPKDWADWREKPLEESYPYLRAWQRKLHDGRWAAVSWPKEYGGRGATLMQQSLFWEEMARVEAPPMANSLGLGLIGPTIIACGTEAQKKRFPSPIKLVFSLLSAPKKSGARASPNRTPAPIWRACKPKQNSTANTTSSTGKKFGPVTAGSATGANS